MTRTEKEKQLAILLNEETFCYIARDKDGELNAFKTEPIKGTINWFAEGVPTDKTVKSLDAFSDYYQYIAFEDKNSTFIKEIINEKGKKYRITPFEKMLLEHMVKEFSFIHRDWSGTIWLIDDLDKRTGYCREIAYYVGEKLFEDIPWDSEDGKIKILDILENCDVCNE